MLLFGAKAHVLDWNIDYYLSWKCSKDKNLVEFKIVKVLFWDCCINTEINLQKIVIYQVMNAPEYFSAHNDGLTD